MPLKFLEKVSLAPLTTFKIGGEARYFFRAEIEEDIAEAFALAEGKGLPIFILGGGSNVLISDAGFDGLVLQIGIRSSEFEAGAEPGTRNSELISVGSGEDWDAFVAYCVENDLAGVECLSGIPGFVGGTPVQNVGAYGQEVAETIVSVRCFDREEKIFVDLKNVDCGFSYRTSIFNSTHRDRYIVASVIFDLKKGGEPKIVYKDLVEHFVGHPTLKEVRDSVLKIRRSKSMVIDAADPNSRSAGSFFKNPIVTREKLDDLISKLGSVPSFPFGDDAKVPAAWLIEKAGFPKGFVLGNAGISSNHSLALINRGDASASDIIRLKERIEGEVEAKFGIRLRPEPVMIGF